MNPDEFDVPVYAHTGPSNFALKGWSLSLQYDPSVLTLVQQQFSSVYQAPTYASDASAGKVDLVTTGISSAQTNADVQGKTALYLMTLRFRVTGGAAADHRRVLNGTVGAMVNQGTQQYVTDEVMPVTDLRAGLQTEGTLSVEAVQGVGVFAFSPTGSFANTATLDGQAITSSVTVLQLYNRATSATAQTTAFTCASSDATVAVVQAARGVSLTAQQTRGGTILVEVLSSAGAIVTQVPLSVWYPVSVSVTVEDALLGRVAGVAVAGSCGTVVRYQHTEATASATFGDVHPAVGQLDVSGLVSFSAEKEEEYESIS